MAPLNIAIVGAPGTGKTTLAHALKQTLAHTLGSPANITTQAQPAADFTLLMGLDLPCTPDAAPTRDAADAQLREWLHTHALPYAVVYGLGHTRVQCALEAIGRHVQATQRTGPADTPWHWNCDHCSDAVCEHRLFSRLLQERAHQL